MTTENESMQEAPKEKTAEYNFNQLRKQLENERYAREQAEMRAKQYEQEKEQWMASQKKQSSQEDEDDYSDPYIDEKRLEKRFKSWESDLDERIDKKAEEKARLLLEKERELNFLREHKDFDEIMSQEMLQKFVDQYPDMVEGILERPDDFNRKKHIYKTIKSLKLDKKQETEEEIYKRIQQNQKSGLYQPSGISPSPYKAVGDFSRVGQEESYRQMQELAARFGGGGVQ